MMRISAKEIKEAAEKRGYTIITKSCYLSEDRTKRCPLNCLIDGPPKQFEENIADILGLPNMFVVGFMDGVDGEGSEDKAKRIKIECGEGDYQLYLDGKANGKQVKEELNL